MALDRLAGMLARDWNGIIWKKGNYDPVTAMISAYAKSKCSCTDNGATLAILSIVVCCAITATPSVVVRHATTAIHSIVSSPAAMAIGGIVLSLTTTGIHGSVFCRAILVIGITVFLRATLVMRGIVICRTTTKMYSKHSNQPKEGHAANMPVTEVKQQATTSRRNKRKAWQCNKNASATTAKGTMTMAMVTAATTTMTTTTATVAASIEG